MALINCPESNKNISSVGNWKNLTNRGKHMKSPVKQFIIVIMVILIMISNTACATSNKQGLDQVKKDLDAYKSQVDILKAENEKLKQELYDLQNKAVLGTNVTEEVPSILNTPSPEEYKTVNVGDKIVFTDVAEVIIEKCEFTKKVLPSQPDGYYSYYEEKDPDNTYFHVIGKYKNLATEEQDFDDIPVKFEAKYQDKYKYTGFKVAEENGGSDFDIFAYAKPLTNLKFHVLIEVPNEVKDNGDFDLYFFNGESRYKIKVK